MGIQLEKSKQEVNLELIIECAQTGEKITGKTIYKGKPVGKWMIQYRNQINKGQNLKLSNDILKQLRELGLLEKKIDSNIDEKIQELIDWNKQYPFARVTNLSYNMQELRRYTNSEKEYQELLKKYERMQGHYTYIKTRKSQGKLTPEQEEMCREGNIRGVFGYPSTTSDLSRKYGLKLEKIDYILSKYGNMKNFVTAFFNNEIDDEDRMLLLDNLNTFIDISKQGDIRHIKFIKYFAKHMENVSIMEEHNNEIKFFDSRKIPELISRLTPKRVQIINLNFGFIDGKEIQRKEIAEMFQVSITAITSSLRKSFLKLARYEKATPVVFQGGELYQFKTQQQLTSEQKNKINSILGRIYSSNLIFIPDEGLTQEPNDITPAELVSIAAKVKEIREEKMQTEEQEKNSVMGNDMQAEIESDNKGFERKSYTPIKNLDLSVRAYNIFCKNGIRTVEQLRYKTLEDLARMRGMGTKTLTEIQDKLRTIIPENEDIFIEDTRQETEMTMLERLKHLKAEKTDEAEALRTKTQEASKLLDSYEQLVNGTVQSNDRNEPR